jgi:hypothetical protein
MGQSLNELRNKILTSIHGRRFGLDKDGFAIGAKGLRPPVTNATSDTTGTAIPNHGIATVVTSTDDSWTVDAPTPGCELSLHTGSSSTGTHTVSLSNATLISSNGVASSNILMQGKGAHVGLVGLTTAVWAVKSVLQTTGGGSVQFTS